MIPKTFIVDITLALKLKSTFIKIDLLDLIDLSASPLVLLNITCFYHAYFRVWLGKVRVRSRVGPDIRFGRISGRIPDIVMLVMLCHVS